jgi:ATP-dependent RNA helicase DeaD
VARVIQVEPPTDVDMYTHRSGRTGRAGKQGTSVLFVTPSHYPAIARGLARAKIAHRVAPIPRPEAIQRAREEKLVAWLAREGDGETIDPHALSIAERIVKSGGLVSALARLIEKAGLHGPTRPRDVRSMPAPREEAPHRARPNERPRPAPAPPSAGWVTFRVTWGGLHGADARRLLAMACRRGKIRGTDVGAIRVEPGYSMIDVAGTVATSFEAEAAHPDPRNPGVRILRSSEPDGKASLPNQANRASQPNQGRGGATPPRRQARK